MGGTLLSEWSDNWGLDRGEDPLYCHRRQKQFKVGGLTTQGVISI